MVRGFALTVVFALTASAAADGQAVAKNGKK